MRTFSFLSLMTLLLLESESGFAQQTIQQQNRQKVDSIKQSVKSLCASPGSSKTVSAKEKKYDRKLLHLLNDIYTNDLEASEIFSRSYKLNRRKWGFDSTNVGGATLFRKRLPGEGNLHAEIAFATVAGKVVYKRVSFETESKTNCESPHDHYWKTDWNYIADVCLPEITIPLEMCLFCYYNSGDTLKKSIVDEHYGPTFKLKLPDSLKWINRYVWMWTDKFISDGIAEPVGEFVVNSDFDVIKLLLFSPNHIVALHAMESLLYFESTGRLQLSGDIRDKMQAVRNAEIPIAWQYSDVVKRSSSYKDLKYTDAGIINKYRRILVRHAFRKAPISSFRMM